MTTLCSGCRNPGRRPPRRGHPCRRAGSEELSVADNVTRKVTIAAIADLAGVSVPTVSRVLNGRSDVASQTRERVEELLTRHGYRRRPSAARTSSGLLDLVFPDLDSPWAVEIIRGVE